MGNTNKEDKITNQIVEEAARLLKDYPELKFYEALKKVKEIYKEAK